MGVVKTLVETWVCNLCGRGASHVHGTGAQLAATHFVETLRWMWIADDTVLCDRCAKDTISTAASRVAAHR